MYGLSFSEEFFHGVGDSANVPSDRPTSVRQAIVSLDNPTRRRIARKVLEVERGQAPIYVETDAFVVALIDKVKETDTCDNMTVPVTVYIDQRMEFSLTIWDDRAPPLRDDSGFAVNSTSLRSGNISGSYGGRKTWW